MTSKRTKAELEEENEDLRAKLEDAADKLADAQETVLEALGYEDEQEEAEQ
jgi:hypothetical protein